MKYCLFTIFLCCVASAAAQDSIQVVTFPHGLIFPPLTANREEAAVGIDQHFGSSRLDVSIGNSLDVVRWVRQEFTIAWGADFFAFALANDYRGYRLKIDAADGFFGMHASLYSASGWQLRFRVLHFSAHLVDGHYDVSTDTWRNNVKPFPFSRNFGEMVAARTYQLGSFGGRGYAGFTYAPIVRPRSIRACSLLGGLELHTETSPHWYGAVHFSLFGIPSYVATWTMQGGVKFGRWNTSGIRLFVACTTGLDPFGEYYNARLQSASVGFAFDFW
jgi:hypothetical protein